MVTTRRLLSAAVAAALLSIAALADAPVASRPKPSRENPTIEPTLPLMIEARFEDVERARGPVSAVLVVELTAADDIPSLLLETVLPDGLWIAGGDLPPRGPMRLARGDLRRFTLPVRADGAEGRVVRLEASFRDAAGHDLRLGQGVVLAPAAPPAGRSHLGAYEVRAVPIEELRR
jgi:hypothetical protein